MKTEFGTGAFRNLCSYINRHTKGLVASKIVLPLLTTLPAAALVFVVRSNDEIQASGASQLPKMAANVLTENILLVVAIAYFYRLFTQYMGAVIKHFAKAKYSLDTKDFVIIDTTLCTVVESKQRRFMDYVKENGRLEKIDASETFLAITKPLDQVRLLTVAIHIVLSHLDEKYKQGHGDYRIGLMQIKDGKPYEWLEYKGGSGSPSLSPEELGAEGSTMMECIKRRQPVFIHDIAKEFRKSHNRRRYTELTDEAAAKGSLICYPVKYSYNNDIPYVITVKTDIKNNFAPEDLYKWAIERFVNRMILEHSLVILREKAQ